MAVVKARRWLKTNWLVVVIAALLGGLVLYDPAGAGRSLVIGARSMAGIAVILLTVFVFMGLFSVWVKEESIARHLGEESGLKGLFYGTLIGTIFHGPQVSIFPFLQSMRDKGARRGVLVAIVSAFSIKIPMIPLELALLGLRFTVVHNVILLLSAPLLAVVMDVLLRSRNGGLSGDG